MKELTKKIITEEYLNGELVSRVIEEVYEDRKVSTLLPSSETPSCKNQTAREYIINGTRTLLL